MDFKCCAKNSQEQKDVSQTYEFLRAIADPNRLRILCFLQKGSKCVCEIVPAIGISYKLTSHHLKQLKKVKLIKDERQGNFIYYSLNRKVIKNYKSLFNQIIK